MATGLGLRVGTYESVAAITTTGDDAHPEYITRESVLYLSDDGTAVLGGALPTDDVHTVTDFLARVGDPDGVAIDGKSAYRPEDLVATALFCLIDLAAPLLEAPTEICATYPSEWPTDAVDALRDALDYLGLRSVSLMSEAEASVLPGEEPAHGAALAALATADRESALDTADGESALDTADEEVAAAAAVVDDPATEEFPDAAHLLVSGPMVIAPAYSALPDPDVIVGSTDITEPEGAEQEKVVPVTRLSRFKQTPVLVAATFAALVALASGVVAVTLDYTEDADLPEIHNAEAALPSVVLEAPAPEQVALPELPAAAEVPIVEAQPVVQQAPAWSVPAQAPPAFMAPPVVEAPPAVQAQPEPNTLPATNQPTEAAVPTLVVPTQVPQRPQYGTLPQPVWPLDRDLIVIEFPQYGVPSYFDYYPFPQGTRTR